MEARKTDGAASTRYVLDYNGLAERAAYAVAENASNGISDAPGGNRNDHGYGPRRIDLGDRAADAQDHPSKDHSGRQHLHGRFAPRTNLSRAGTDEPMPKRTIISSFCRHRR